MSEGVEEDHDVFRAVVHPTIYKSKAFSHDKMFYLQFNETDKSIVTSLVWRKYLPTEGALHSYGCSLAARRNAILQEKAELKAKNRRVYCGAYQIGANSIHDLSSDDFLNKAIEAAEVVHAIEFDEEAHVNLVVKVRLDWQGDVALTMTAIVDRLWNACRGPLLHICPCDAQLSSHPSINLPSAPNGQYVFPSNSMGSDDL